ncbi:MAG TPA: RNA polymerase factor sigma-54 [Patescibacteria group bacterium]|nr:RNA polymerase factor sigma-54 [Patescibacteria group bacterium]
MKLSMSLNTSLMQTLTPQQIQYLKLLQLPVLQLEQHIRQELEENPMLEEGDDFGSDDISLAEVEIHESAPTQTTDFQQEATQPELNVGSLENGESYGSDLFEDYTESREITDNEKDPFEYYDMAWEDSSETKKKDTDDDGDDYGFQYKAPVSFIEDLTHQFVLLNLTEEERIAGDHILGNIDSDGYLRRDIKEILDEINTEIAEENIARQHEYAEAAISGGSFLQGSDGYNPARDYALIDFNEDEEIEIVPKHFKKNGSTENGSGEFLKPITTEQLEEVLKKIQALEPPGIGARTIQECLLVQLDAIQKPNAAQKLAREVIAKCYDAFAMKHYNEIAKQLNIELDYLREALDAIRRLNPKPGGGAAGHEHNTVIPDFVVERDEDGDDFIVNLNDSRVPPVKVSAAYERLRKSARKKQFSKEARDWLRKKNEDAKFLIQAIRQRKMTMLKVMTAIVELQKDFFKNGQSGHKPLIYKDVAEATGLDISTISRIVNGKYVQTEFGTFELRYFFSESLSNDEGEEISTRIIKQKIKEMIDKEPKGKPLSDDKLAKDLKAFGYNVARRTVAKYREQLRIPVARLRKEL